MFLSVGSEILSVLVCTLRFSGTVHTREPVCEVGGGWSHVVVCFLEWEVPLKEFPKQQCVG